MTPDDAATFDWKWLYQSALFETDPVKIQDRIVDAQIAILQRGNKLLASAPCPEHQQLDYAMRFLRLLQHANSARGEAA
jgi:hypothetical protein